MTTTGENKQEKDDEEEDHKRAIFGGSDRAYLTAYDERRIDYLLMLPQDDYVVMSGCGIDVLLRDVRTLCPGRRVNDVCINAYLQLVVSRSVWSSMNCGENRYFRQPKRLPPVYAFNSFFFTKLATKGLSALSSFPRYGPALKDSLPEYAAATPPEDEGSIDRQTLGKENGGTRPPHEMILIPAFLDFHWVLLVLHPRVRKIRYFDSLLRRPGLHGHLSRISRAITQFINSQDDKSPEKWQFRRVTGLPQQQSCHDCGVFTCLFAESATREGAMNFSSSEIYNLRRRLILEILIQEIL